MRRLQVLLGLAAASWFGAAWIATPHAAAPAPPVQAGLPEGEGRAVVEKLCSTCHGLEYLSPSRRSVRNWLDTIELMKSFGAEATDEQWATITTYVVDSLAVLNANKAAADEFGRLFHIDEKAAQAVVEYRDKQGGFKTIDDVKKAPGLDAGRIDALGDRLIVQ